MEQERNSKIDDLAGQGTNDTREESSVRGQQPIISIDENHAETGSADDRSGSSNKGGTPPANNSKLGKELVEWIKALAIAGLLVFVIRWFLVSPFIVDGPSMQPNFWNRERIIVNKILYEFREPKQGEVIVFHVPEEGRDFIKRVIGVPGDTVKVEGDTVYINGKPLEENYLKEAYEDAHAAGPDSLYNVYDSDLSNFPNSSFPDGKVPEGMLFVMGDNRPNSEDSRRIGFIPMDRIVGRADLVFWPMKDFHFITH